MRDGQGDRSLTPESSATLKAIYLRASSVPGKGGLYFVGPYGRRVSFASQQRRAFNTVWALEQAGELRPGKRVAVIGAGLAGLTIASGLLARRCIVWLYEARPRILEGQRTTSHRYIHPTVNFWPEVEIEDTTEFPFFDWYSSSCDGVIRSIEREWDGFFADKITRIYPGTVVNSITKTSSGGVLVSATGFGPQEAEYDLAMITTGFGSELNVAGTMNVSYWTDDYLDTQQNLTKTIAISGIGDGGLIDTLRVVHRDFDKGKLPVRLVKALSGTGMRERILTLEEVVQNDFATDSDLMSEKYKEKYTEELENLSVECLRMLDDSLFSRSPVLLYGKLRDPYTQFSAPIHKLMICHAIMRGRVKYMMGNVLDGPANKVGRSRAKAINTDIFLARHGSTPPLGNILTPDEIRILKEEQLKIADLLNDKPYDDAVYWDGFTDYPKRDPGNSDFVNYRYPLASAYILAEFSNRLSVELVDGSPTYMMDRQGFAPPPTGAPSSLFGIPLGFDEGVIANAFSER